MLPTTKRRRRRGRNDGRVVSDSTVPIPRAPDPDRNVQRFERARLVFGQTYVLNNVGAKGASDYIKMNYPAVISFNFGSNTPGGYVQLTNVWQQTRVLKTKVTLSAINLETFPVLIWTCPIGNINPTTGAVPALNDVSTAALWDDVAANPAMKYTTLCSASSKPNGIVSSTMDIAAWTGSKWTGTSDQYSSFNQAAPTHILYHGFGLLSPTANLASGISLYLRVEYDVVMFDYALNKNGL